MALQRLPIKFQRKEKGQLGEGNGSGLLERSIRTVRVYSKGISKEGQDTQEKKILMWK